MQLTRDEVEENQETTVSVSLRSRLFSNSTEPVCNQVVCFRTLTFQFTGSSENRRFRRKIFIQYNRVLLRLRSFFYLFKLEWLELSKLPKHSYAITAEQTTTQSRIFKSLITRTPGANAVTRLLYCSSRIHIATRIYYVNYNKPCLESRKLEPL